VWVRRLAVFGPMATDCYGRLLCVPSERQWASAGDAVMLAADGASVQQCVSEVLTQMHVTGI
jgi:hypothetical protein